MTDLNSTSEEINNQLVFSSGTSKKPSPLLTKKEKKQNRSEIEMNNYIFSQKLGTVVVLRNTILEELTYGNTAVSNTTQLKPQDSGQKLDELPIEAIWGIFEYLPPIKLGWMGTLCKKFQDATNDNMLWQIISKRHQNLFIWDKLRIGDEHNTSHNTPIYGTLDTLTKPPKTQVNEIIGESDFRGVQPITNLTERITYIEKLENAKEHMIKKIIEIKKINKLKQEYIIRKEIRQCEFDIKEDFFHKSYKLDIYRVTCFFAFTLTSFYILLDLSKNKIISEAYIMLPFQISWFIYLVTYTYTNYRYRSRFLKPFFVKVYLTLFIILLVIAFFSIKLGTNSKLKWKQVFLPIYILIIYFSILAVKNYLKRKQDRTYEKREWILYFSIIVNFLLITIFLFILSFKLDNDLSLKWAHVFIPLFMLHGFLLGEAIVVSLHTRDSSDKFFMLVSFFVAIFAYLIPFFVFEILLILYLNNSKISRFTYTLIPIHVLQLVILFQTIWNTIGNIIDKF